MNTKNKSISGKLNNLGSFLENNNSAKKNSGEPILLDITQIHEDKNQPRNYFDADALNELAASIKARGIKTPISVRHEIGDFYTINHGARRFKAAKIAGLKQVPVFIDDDYKFADQIVENVQRENLSALEIASACDKLVNQFGMSKTDIAKILGKSNAYITQHLKLLNLSKDINEWFKRDKVTDITVVNELETLYQKHGNTVIEFFGKIDNITRPAIKDFKEFLKALKNPNPIEIENESSNEPLDNINPIEPVEEKGEKEEGKKGVIELTNDEDLEDGREPSIATPNENQHEETTKKPVVKNEKGNIKKPYISVKFKDELYKLDLTKAGRTMSFAWIIKEDNPDEILEVELKNVILVSLFDDVKI